MSKVGITLMIAFVLALGAGVVLGFAAARRVDVSPVVPVKPPEDQKGSWLRQQLNLTDQQNEQIRAIWQQVMVEQGRVNSERRRSLERERDGALLALLTTDQRQEYDRLLKQYELELAELNRERDRLRQEAVERTRQVLTDQQRQKYDELLKERDRERERDRGDRGPRGPRRGPGGTTGPAAFGSPATRPAAEPAPARPGHRG